MRVEWREGHAAGLVVRGDGENRNTLRREPLQHGPTSAVFEHVGNHDADVLSPAARHELADQTLGDLARMEAGLIPMIDRRLQRPDDRETIRQR
jgi:hypothetical protein